jgi:hypothetical protein
VNASEGLRFPIGERQIQEVALSEEIHKAGQEVGSATGADVDSVLNRIFNRFLGWPFRASPGFATDRESKKTDTFGSVIYSTSDSWGDLTGPVEVPADSLAAVIDIYESMDLEQFRAAYQRIGRAKTLAKTPPARFSGVAHTTTTLGIILAIRATLPLETFAEELDHLNRQTPSAQWPDMVAVLSTGTINYAVQFPSEKVTFDFLPPEEGATAAHTMPAYVVMVVRPTGGYTFNKMAAFLIAHLAIFSPGANVPNFALVLNEVPKLAITLRSYQYNLSGDLLPVPREFYNDRYLPPFPMRIEDRKGTLLSTAQFLPWQDGGVVLLRGNLPLGAILVFLGRDKLKRGGALTRGNLQISYVLPIEEKEFMEMLARFARQSNMVVRREAPRLVVQKLLDEGSQSPFICRLSMGILRLRDVVFPEPADRDAFDKASHFVFLEFLSAREAAQDLVEAWREHLRKVSQGDIAQIRETTIQIDENIDKHLRKQLAGFLNAAVRTLKQGMQKLTGALQINIGFLFQKSVPFAKAAAALALTDAPLAEYLQQSRSSWCERLLQMRNGFEHEGWMLQRVKYSLEGASISVEEPSISGRPVSEFVTIMVDRLACFVEEVTAHCLQRRMPQDITITQIPLSQRAVEAPERFRVTLANGGMPAWRIGYHQESFEET